MFALPITLRLLRAFPPPSCLSLHLGIETVYTSSLPQCLGWKRQAIRLARSHNQPEVYRPILVKSYCTNWRNDWGKCVRQRSFLQCQTVLTYVLAFGLVIKAGCTAHWQRSKISLNANGLFGLKMIILFCSLKKIY